MIGKVDFHVVKEGMLDVAKAQVATNSEIAKGTGAVINRYMLISQKDPSKLVTITFWKNKEAIGEFGKVARAKAEAAGQTTGPGRPWESIEGDEYDVTTLV